MSELSLVERAQSGNVEAIAALMNTALRSLGIRARAALQGEQLHVLLEAEQPPAQSACIEFIQRGLAQLQRLQAASAVVYGRQLGQVAPSWVQQIQLASRAVQPGSPAAAAAPSIITTQLATVTIPDGLHGPDAQSWDAVGWDSEIIQFPDLDVLEDWETMGADQPSVITPRTGAAPLDTDPGQTDLNQSEPRLSTPKMAVSTGPGPVLPAVILRAEPASGTVSGTASGTASGQMTHVPRGPGSTDRHRWQLMLKSVLKNDRVFFGLLLGVPLVIVLLSGYILNRYVLGAQSKSSAQLAAAPPIETKVASQSDEFDTAMQRASTAVELSHYSKTPADWQQVAREWQGAIAKMKALPPDHPQHAIAQIKVKEYQQNLDQVMKTQLAK